MMLCLTASWYSFSVGSRSSIFVMVLFWWTARGRVRMQRRTIVVETTTPHQGRWVKEWTSLKEVSVACMTG